jgi:hypothetical protein
MATKKRSTTATKGANSSGLASSSVDELLLAALEKGGDTLETGGI